MASLASASNFASDSFKTKSGKELTITFIKHGSLMLTYDNHSIQVDPVSEYADYTTFPKADIILITHEHGDHLDPKAIQAVEKSGTEIIANENSQKKLGKGKVLKNGDTETARQLVHSTKGAAANLGAKALAAAALELEMAIKAGADTGPAMNHFDSAVTDTLVTMSAFMSQ